MKFIPAIFLFLLTLFVFVYIADVVVVDNKTQVDQELITDLNAYHSPEATTTMETFTFFGSSFFLMPAYLLLIGYCLVKKHKRLALNVAAIGLTTTGILFLLKNIFKRSRPLDPVIQHVAGFSFPSGHSFSSFTFYGLIAFLLWQTDISTVWKITASILLFLFAATIALSRVYLRVHFPSDVIAGFCLSIACLILSYWIFAGKKEDKIAA